MIRISIIIPIYNSASWLEQCLCSVVFQDLSKDEYEIICINDGSSDNSVEILTRFKEKFPQIKIYNQENSGVSAARNLGIQNAIGNYITFLDSDDYIGPNSLSKISDFLSENNLDVLYATLTKVNEKGEVLGLIENPGKEGVVEAGIFHGRRTFPPTFYRRSLIGDIRFCKDIALGEDTVFNACVQSRAKRVSIFSGLYYNYLIRSNSLSKQGQSSKAYSGFLKAIALLEDFRKSENMESPEETKYFDRVIKIFITRLLDLSIIPGMDMKRYREMLNLLKNLNKTYLLKDFESSYKFVSVSPFLFALNISKSRLKAAVYNKFKI